MSAISRLRFAVVDLRPGRIDLEIAQQRLREHALQLRGHRRVEIRQRAARRSSGESSSRTLYDAAAPRQPLRDAHVAVPDVRLRTPCSRRRCCRRRLLDVALRPPL